MPIVVYFFDSKFVCLVRGLFLNANFFNFFENELDSYLKNKQEKNNCRCTNNLPNAKNCNVIPSKLRLVEP